MAEFFQGIAQKSNEDNNMDTKTTIEIFPFELLPETNTSVGTLLPRKVFLAYNKYIKINLNGKQLTE